VVIRKERSLSIVYSLSIEAIQKIKGVAGGVSWKPDEVVL